MTYGPGQEVLHMRQYHSISVLVYYHIDFKTLKEDLPLMILKNIGALADSPSFFFNSNQSHCQSSTMYENACRGKIFIFLHMYDM